MIALRCWRPADADDLVACCNDPQLAYWLDNLPVPYTTVHAHTYITLSLQAWQGGGVETAFAITDTVTAAVLGSCGVFWQDEDAGVAEIGYWVRRDVRGRGIASRAVTLAAGWVFATVGWERLELRVDTRNTASQRVAEKAGFDREGVLRSAAINTADQTRVDLALYALVRSDLAAS